MRDPLPAQSRSVRCTHTSNEGAPVLKTTTQDGPSTPTCRAWLALVLLGWACVQGAFAQDRVEPPLCPRGEPEAVFQKDIPEVVSRSFRQKNSHTATEMVQLKRGDHLVIQHSGCEYVVITITVEPATATQSEPSRREAYAAASAWLSRLHGLGVVAPFNLSLAAKTLQKQLSKPVVPRWDKEIPVDGSGTDFLQTRVTVEKPDAHRKTGSVQFYLITGPL
jgi:hypothetical protein